MCFVLDVCAFPGMFKATSKDYAEFEPLRDWLDNHSRTSIVIGGTHYRNEMGKMKKYLALFVELEKKRKLSNIIDDKVDAEEKRVRNAVNNKQFNDPHIVALFCASKCIIFASLDQRADPFIKMKCLYPKRQRRPRIFHSANNAACQ